MSVKTKSLYEINRDAIVLLSKELGIANTLRFINQYNTGAGNYTEERKEFFKDLTLEGIVTEIKKERPSYKVDDKE
ncbi:MAG TPA: hypothetical protein VFG39_05015 [Balneolaceae bacterium]|nr:hypothetical protein [Balneolaceae bacterium]